MVAPAGLVRAFPNLAIARMPVGVRAVGVGGAAAVGAGVGAVDALALGVDGAVVDGEMSGGRGDGGEDAGVVEDVADGDALLSDFCAGEDAGGGLDGGEIESFGAGGENAGRASWG